MSDKVISLVRPKNEPPRPEVISLLEELLEEARKGELDGFVCATSYSDGRTGEVCAGLIYDYDVLGRLTSLTTQVNVEILAQDDD